MPAIALELPPGIGLKPLPRSSWETSDSSLMGKVLMWEPRKREHRYILGVDVSDGVGKDRSVIEVLRMGTLNQPAEEVAQFVSDEIDPIAFASVIDALGRFYRDGDEYEALAAIETNNHGLATQAHLNQHLGYSNLFIWQRWDARDPRRRLSQAFGWYTTARTRPIILTELRNGITTFDEHTGQADYILNSPFTLEELKDFQVPPGGAFYQAEAAAGAHDDCIFACAIAYHADITTRYGENEPLSEKRRRLSEEHARKSAIAARVNSRVDFQNSDWTYDEIQSGEDQPPIFERPEGALSTEEGTEWGM